MRRPRIRRGRSLHNNLLEAEAEVGTAAVWVGRLASVQPSCYLEKRHARNRSQRLTPAPTAAVRLQRGKMPPISAIEAIFRILGWPKHCHQHRTLGSSSRGGGKPLCWCWCPCPGLQRNE
eukprot:271037-Pyramimonas_sp.AAC.1